MKLKKANTEIKFKAWDKIKKEFIRFPKIKIIPNTNNSLVIDLNDGDRVKFLQYTGLNDKNNNEIFEGDILKWDTEIISIFRHREDNEFGMKKEKSVDKYCVGETFHILGFTHLLTEKYEIIGNIYENADLLK